jgi:hypothetical protein
VKPLLLHVLSRRQADRERADLYRLHELVSRATTNGIMANPKSPALADLPNMKVAAEANTVALQMSAFDPKRTSDNRLMA